MGERQHMLSTYDFMAVQIQYDGLSACQYPIQKAYIKCF